MRMKSEGYEYDISVIIPIYNVEEYLEECLDSLLRQGDVKLEVIMIDDGSPDRCGDIADEYAERYDSFTCYHIQNGGLSHARNFGASKAHGKYIAFFDSDDILVDRTYEKMLYAAEVHGCELTICRVARFSSSHKDYSYLHEQAFFQYETVSHISKNPWLVYDTTSWNKLILRSFYEREQFKFPEDILYEDIPVAIPMHFLCNKVAMVWDVGYMWRIREGANRSLTQQISSKKNLSDRIESICMLDRFYDEHVFDQSLRKMKEIKTMKIDLFMFAMLCERIPTDQAYETIDTLNRYIDDHIGVKDRDTFSEEEVISELPVMYQQIFTYVRERDLTSLREALKYWKEYSVSLEIIEDKEERDLLVNLPDSLFPMSNRSVLKEKAMNRPRAMIESVSVESGKCSIQVVAYYPGINITDTSQQKAAAMLVNTCSGEKMPLVVSTSDAGKQLTGARGETIERPSGKTVLYNYDGTGFKIDFDFRQLIEKSRKSKFKAFRVLVDIENRFFAGSRFLSVWKQKFVKSVKDHTYIIDDTAVHVSFDMFGEIVFSLTDNPTIVWKAKKSNNKLVLITYCKNSSDNRLASAELCLSDKDKKSAVISRAKCFRLRGLFYSLFIVDFGKSMIIKGVSEGDGCFHIRYQRKDGSVYQEPVYREHSLKERYELERAVQIKCYRAADSTVRITVEE